MRRGQVGVMQGDDLMLMLTYVRKTKNPNDYFKFIPYADIQMKFKF